MLDKISNTFKDISRKLTGKSKITEKNIAETLEDIKLALLEADVNRRVVRRFINQTSQEALGDRVLRSVDPGQQFIKIIHDKMVHLLGDNNEDIKLKGPDTISSIMIVGLQGTGKTTSTAKLALKLKKEGRRVLLVACDLKRAAAVEQLKILAQQLDVRVFHEEGKAPVEQAKLALKYAKKNLFNTLLFDTAGRIQANEELLVELQQLKKIISPDETLLVADSMTGQAAVDVTVAFNEAVEISGLILTKFDSDTKGGAAISIKSITGKAIKYIGVGERLEDLDIFYPERIASRILGMGDIVSLVEKAQELIDAKESEAVLTKISKSSFTLADMLSQLQQVKKMGKMGNLLELMPNMTEEMQAKFRAQDDSKYKEAIILSMTSKERANHRIIGPPRRKRIAQGSGTSVAKVNRLLKEFEKSRLTMKKMLKNKKYQEQVMKQMGI